MVLGLGMGVVGFIALLSDALSDRFIIGDFAQDYASAAAWAEGEDPYGPLPELRDRYIDESGALFPGIEVNPHPPARIALFRPLAAQSYRTARVLWFALGAASLAGAVGLLARAFGATPRLTIGAAGVSLLLPAAQLDLRLGQIDALLLLLLTGAWLLARDGRPFLAGATLGTASALALFPLFMIVPLLRAGRIKAAVTAVGVASAATIAAALAMRPSALATYATEAAPTSSSFWTPAPHNLSLTAIPLRWLRHTFWRPEAVDLPALATTLAAVIVIGCAVAAIRTSAARSGDIFLAALPWMLLASPIAWDHYLLLAIPFLVALVTRCAHDKTLLRSPLLAVALVLVVIARLPSLAVIHPTSPVDAALWWALPGYALFALALFDFRARRQDAAPRA